MTHAQPRPPAADGGDAHAAIEAEYRRIIDEQLVRMGSDSMATLEIVHAGDGRDGLGIYRAMVRLVRWERKAAVRLLLGLPVLQYKLTQALAASWLPEVSHFGGLWLHPAGELQERERVTDLRRMIMDFESTVVRPGSSRVGESLWSLPGDVAAKPQSDPD